ncbi:MAG: class I adenylate-forming enzyme family protein, partial [Vulcanimicrobiaceae bacterium]
MIVDLWDGALADRAEALALNEITYRRLHLGARRVAARLQTLGLAAGDRICIYSENRLGFVYAFLAALRLGAIAVPANVLYRRNDLAHLLRDARPAIVIVSPSVVAELTQAQVHCRSVDISQIEAWADDETIQPIPVLSRQADEIALIVYTSGTTGRSKGAMLSHGALAAIAAQLISAWRWQADDTLLLSLPLFHIHGLVAGLTCALAAGARTVLHERFDAQRVLATFESE